MEREVPADPRTVVHLCSTAKAVTAVVVMCLVRHGTLRLDDPVRDYLDVPSDSGYRSPTLRELLAHAGGVEDPDGSFPGGPAPAPSAADVVDGRTDDHVGAVRVSHAPGSGFRYSDAGYCLLERVVENATGLPFALVAHRMVVEPLGLTRTAFWDGGAPVPGSDPSLGGALRAVADRAATGHRPDGAPVPGGRAHYAGLAASGLWASVEDTAVLFGDLARSWSGEDGVVLDGRLGTTMLTGVGEPGVGLGVFVLASPGGRCVMTQGWGDGFQGQVRVYPGQHVLAALTNQDPGVDQSRSVVGTTLDRLASERGLEP